MLQNTFSTQKMFFLPLISKNLFFTEKHIDLRLKKETPDVGTSDDSVFDLIFV